MKSNYQVETEVKNEAKKGIISQFTGVLSALLPLLAILGISLEWFTQEFIDQLYIFLAALVPFAFNLYAIYKNHFSGKKAQQQNKVLKERGMK